MPRHYERIAREEVDAIIFDMKQELLEIINHNRSSRRIERLDTGVRCMTDTKPLFPETGE